MSDHPRTAKAPIGRLVVTGVMLLVAGLAGLAPVAHGVADPVVEGRQAAAPTLSARRRVARAHRRHRAREAPRRAPARLVVGRPRPAHRRSVLATTAVLRL